MYATDPSAVSWGLQVWRFPNAPPAGEVFEIPETHRRVIRVEYCDFMLWPLGAAGIMQSLSHRSSQYNSCPALHCGIPLSITGCVRICSRHIRRPITIAQALVKFNESLAMNKNLRERIDTLRRERVVFDSIYKKLERELHEKKKVRQRQRQ